QNGRPLTTAYNAPTPDGHHIVTRYFDGFAVTDVDTQRATVYVNLERELQALQSSPSDVAVVQDATAVGGDVVVLAGNRLWRFEGGVEGDLAVSSGRWVLGRLCLGRCRRER